MTSVIHVSVLLFIMNFVITLLKKCRLLWWVTMTFLSHSSPHFWLNYQFSNCSTVKVRIEKRPRYNYTTSRQNKSSHDLTFRNRMRGGLGNPSDLQWKKINWTWSVQLSFWFLGRQITLARAKDWKVRSKAVKRWQFKNKTSSHKGVKIMAMIYYASHFFLDLTRTITFNLH